MSAGTIQHESAASLIPLLFPQLFEMSATLNSRTYPCPPCTLVLYSSAQDFQIGQEV